MKIIKGKEIGGIIVDGLPKFILNYCPHAGAEICKGRIKNFVYANTVGKIAMDKNKKVLICPWHKWEYNLEKGHSITKGSGRVKLYEFEYDLDGNNIFIRI